MQLRIVAVGSMGTGGFSAAVDDYVERVDRYVTTEVTEVGKGSGSSPTEKMRAEAEMLVGAAPEGGTWVALDEDGRSISSESLSEWIDDQMVGGVRYISFFVGGPHGLDPEFRRETCDWSLSLSKLTLSHELARAVLAEQLYRAMTIVRGEPYHNA